MVNLRNRSNGYMRRESQDCPYNSRCDPARSNQPQTLMQVLVPKVLEAADRQRLDHLTTFYRVNFEVRD